MIRIIKIVLAAFVALFGLIYALQNIVNLQAAFGFVALMASMPEQVAYSKSIGWPITSPLVVWAMLWIIIIIELAVGALAAKGVFDMLQARTADAAAFNKAKTCAIRACGLGVMLYFGVFTVFGGAYFQMWQVAAAQGPLSHATGFSIQFAALFLIFAAKDD